MRQLCPLPLEDVDPASLYAADARAPHADGRPWVLLNMIATADGATALDGRSGALGGTADKRVFAAIRSVADVIVVAGGTVRAEGYGPPSGGARLAVVSGSLDLDPALRLFTQAKEGLRPWLVTTAKADASSLGALVDDVIVAGDDRVDMVRAIDALGVRGARVVLCEGGPSLNGQLVEAGILDELCLSLAPLVAGGDSARIAHGPTPPAPLAMRLDRVLEEDSYLFLRYLTNSTQ